MISGSLLLWHRDLQFLAANSGNQSKTVAFVEAIKDMKKLDLCPVGLAGAVASSLEAL